MNDLWGQILDPKAIWFGLVIGMFSGWNPVFGGVIAIFLASLTMGAFAQGEQPLPIVGAILVTVGPWALLGALAGHLLKKTIRK